MKIGFRPHPSDFGKRPLNIMILFKKSFQRANLFWDQFERQLVTKKLNLIRAYPYPKFLINLYYHIFRNAEGNYPPPPISPYGTQLLTG